MNEQDPAQPVAPSTPAPAPLPPQSQPQSIWPGFWLAWGALIGGYTVIVGFLGTFASVIGGSGVPDGVWVLIGFSPWLLILGLIFWFATNGKPHLAKGVAIGLASIFGLGLLLFAACFGILSSTSFR